MPYHEWGDENFDWVSLGEAGYYIQRRCKQFARMGIHIKEKYGTLRISTTCAYWTYWPIYSLFYPGYCSYHWPRWMIGRIEYPIAWVTEKTGIMGLMIRYQTAVLKYFWKRAAKKWPHIAEEILDDYDWTVGDI